MALLLFLASFALYAWLVPHTFRVWWLTGDEPHYLVMAHSLAFDGDLDLANNYAAKDYQLFLPDEDTDPHTGPGARGGEYSWHSIGLPVLLAPFYRLGGRLGATYFMNAVAALAVAGTYLLAYELARARWAALVGALVIALTPPTLLYSSLIYPEMLVGLVVVWAGLALVKVGGRGLSDWIRVGISAALLPWLGARYLPLALGILAAALGLMAKGRERDRRAWAAAFIPAIGSLALVGLYNYWVFGSPSPSAPAAAANVGTKLPFPFGLWERVAGATLGWLLDQKMGLFVFSPVYILIPLGLAAAIKERRLWPLLFVAGLYYSFLLYFGFWIQWSVPPRYLVPLLPLGAALLAYGLSRARGPASVLVLAVLLALSLLNGAFLVAVPDRAYSDLGWIGSGSKLLTYYARRLPFDPRRLFPDFDQIAFYHPVTLGEGSQTGSLAEDPDACGRVGVHFGRRSLHAQAGLDRPGYLFLAAYGRELPAGSYALGFRLRGRGDGSSGPVLVLEARSAGDEVLARREIGGAEFGEGYRGYLLPFTQVAPDGVKFGVYFTGEGEAWCDSVVLVQRNPFQSWGRALLWAAGIALLTAFWAGRVKGGQGLPEASLKEGSPGLFRGLVLGLVFLIVAVLGANFHALAAPRSYPAAALRHEVGRLVADPSGRGGRALRAEVNSDRAGWLAVTIPEVFPKGEYRACFWLKRGEGASGSAPVAELDITSDVGVLRAREVRAEELAAGSYQPICLELETRLRRLEFRALFSDASDLWVGGIEVSPQN